MDRILFMNARDGSVPNLTYPELGCGHDSISITTDFSDYSSYGVFPKQPRSDSRARFCVAGACDGNRCERFRTEMKTFHCKLQTV